MDTSKDIIKSRLKDLGRDREWLAERLGKALNTINNWLSTAKPIPDGIRPLIARVLNEEEIAQTQRAQLHEPRDNIIRLHFSDDEFTLINEAANARDQLIREWAVAALIAAAQAEPARNEGIDTEGSHEGPILQVKYPQAEEQLGSVSHGLNEDGNGMVEVPISEETAKAFELVKDARRAVRAAERQAAAKGHPPGSPSS